MANNVNKNLHSIVRWNVFESGSYLTAGKYEPVFPFAMTLFEARSCAQSFRSFYPHLRFVVLPYGCSF